MEDYIAWTDDLSVHVDSIDRRNKELVKQFSELREAVLRGGEEQEIRDILRFIAAYTVEHFGYEEKLMGPDYVDSSEHKKAHADFIEEIVWFLGAFEAGDVDSRLVLWVAKRLWKKTRQHILAMDKGLAKVLGPETSAGNEFGQQEDNNFQETGVGAARLIGFPGLRALKPF